MTINASSLNTGTINFSSLSASSASTSSQSSSELSEEEKLYDADNDGTLSATEQAAMQEAQLREKIFKSADSNKKTAQKADSAEISAEALQKLKESESSYNELAAAQSVSASDNQQSLLSNVISEYQKHGTTRV